MTSFPNSPRLLRSSLVTLDPLRPVPRAIVFQYNPDTLTRSLQAQANAGGGERSEALRLRGAPVETLRLDVDLDAADQLERADAATVRNGLHPQLAALETLLYPATTSVLASVALGFAGMIEVAPPEAPLTLLVWGDKRVLPVRVTEFSVAEESHDVNLNPIRARVSLALRVLSYNDLSVTHPGFGLFVAHQLTKEALALAGSVAGAPPAGAR